MVAAAKRTWRSTGASSQGWLWAQALKTIEKRGLQSMAREAGLDLASLPYVDASPARRDFLAARGTPAPPMPKDKRAMKNPEKLAASTKNPMVGQYLPGGRIKFVRSE